MQWDRSGLNGYQTTDIDIFHLGTTDVRCFIERCTQGRHTGIVYGFKDNNNEDPRRTALPMWLQSITTDIFIYFRSLNHSAAGCLVGENNP